MAQYVPVAEDENEDPIELPTEPDGNLLLSNLAAQFPGASGLRYRSPDTNAMRAVKLVNGVLHQPAELDSWCSPNTRVIYICTYSKDYRRRADADDFGYGQSRRYDPKRCTDLIVLGLPYKADEDQLRDYFSQFGQVMMTQVKRDHDGTSKGYGFIRFKDVESQSNCLSAKHQIDGRRCEVKIPNSQADGSATAGLSKRVFVGRVTEDMTENVLRDFFSQYGEIEEIYIPKPFRAFAFVTFADPDAAASLIGQNCQIKGVTVQIGPANPKQQTRNRYPGAGSGFGGVGSGLGAGVGSVGSGPTGAAAAGGGGDFAVPPPSMGGWGPPTGPYGTAAASAAAAVGAGGAPYQDVVNSLASNPQLLAAALQQAYHQQPAAVTAAAPAAPADPQQASTQHYGNYAHYQLDNAAQYQHNGSYGYQQPQQQQQQQQHHHHHPQHQLQQWQ